MPSPTTVSPLTKPKSVTTHKPSPIPKHPKQKQKQKPKKYEPEPEPEPNANKYYTLTNNNLARLVPIPQKKKSQNRASSSTQPLTIINLINKFKLEKGEWTLEKQNKKSENGFQVTQQIFKNKKLTELYKSFASDIHATILSFKRESEETICGVYPHISIVCKKKYLNQNYPGILDSVDPEKEYDNKTIKVRYGVYLSPFDKKNKYWYTLINLVNQESKPVDTRQLANFTNFLTDFNFFSEFVYSNLIHSPIINKEKLKYDQEHCFSTK